jgi:hypothetical protein
MNQEAERVEAAIARLEAQVQSRLGRHIGGLLIRREADGLVLRGQTRTYYAKQIAQHAVMEVSNLPILANQIEVI